MSGILRQAIPTQYSVSSYRTHISVMMKSRQVLAGEVFKEAAKYLFEHEDKSFVFTGTLDGIWAKERWLEIGGKIVLGGYVDFSDTQFHPEGSLIRMIGIKRYVNNPYSPEIGLSNDPVGTSVTSELDKIETNEVDVRYQV